MKALWDWLSGKKTVIATIFWSITMPSLNIIYPNGIPSTLNKTTLIIGTILGVFGIGHKAVKNWSTGDNNVDPPVDEANSPK